MIHRVKKCFGIPLWTRGKHAELWICFGGVEPHIHPGQASEILPIFGWSTFVRMHPRSHPDFDTFDVVQITPKFWGRPFTVPANWVHWFSTKFLIFLNISDRSGDEPCLYVSRVHIIVTCLNPALIESSLLVFKTIQKGFPNSQICVYGNALPKDVLNRMPFPVRIIRELISHDSWIEKLIHTEHEPFWIVDTDVVFFDSVEHFKAPLFGGRYEPEFYDEWTRSVHASCLHPSLMYFNPVELRCAIFQWRTDHIPKHFPNAIANLIRQQFTAHDGKTYFNDTCSGLHHAFGGTKFPDEINARFEHLHCGTVADDISKEVPSLAGLVDLHRVVCENPEMSRGLMAKQLEYYESTKQNG